MSLITTNTKQATPSAIVEAAAPAAGATEAASGDGARDFDFLMGSWKIHNRRLRVRLKGSTAWDEFEATGIARPLLSGAGNEDEFRTDHWPGFIGMSFRFFDPVTRKWSITWADSRRGRLDPPVVGAFENGAGVFEGDDAHEGRPVRVRFIWSRIATPSPRWEQAFSADGGKTWETNWVMDFTRAVPRDVALNAGTEHLGSFPVVEIRRYKLVDGARERFVRYFESFFEGAFQQLGALALGQFFERGERSRFTWLRAYHDMAGRLAVNTAFYDGPLFREHRSRMNALLLDSDDVLLLRPLSPERGVPVLRAVDPFDEVTEPRGAVVAQIFAATPGRVDELARDAEAAFARYRAAGARESGVLVSIEEPNNFPRHPIRTDGPHLVWLGVVPDEAVLAKVRSLAESAAKALDGSALVRGVPETLVLEPTDRSRLRWR